MTERTSKQRDVHAMAQDKTDEWWASVFNNEDDDGKDSDDEDAQSK